MKNLRVFKLITGEEILAEVVSDVEYQYEMKNAIQLIMSQDASGKIGITGIPWGSSVMETITINEEHIVYSGTPNPKLVEMYEQAFSKLAVPSKTLITG